jgi:hypothetical protein
MTWWFLLAKRAADYIIHKVTESWSREPFIKEKGSGGLNRMDMILEVYAVTQCLKLSGWAVPKHANTEQS